jgi:uncharacterized membrane protein HdeD (DUF308 family)
MGPSGRNLIWLPDDLLARLVFVLSGLVSIVFGVLIAAQPAAWLLVVVWLTGVYAIVFGIMHSVVYFESRSLSS